MEKREIMTKIVILIFVSFMFTFLFYFSGILGNGGITGFAVFESGNQSVFDEGNYTNTEYNGSAVILIGENLSGTYVSKVFDASSEANWNNISWESQIRESLDSYLYSAMHPDTNITEVFSLDENYYLADMKDSSKNFYLNFSEDLIDGTILKLYAKEESGVTIGIYAQSDSNGDNPLGTLIVNSTTGDWYNITLDITTSTNAIWIGEGNGSGTDPKEEFDYIYAELPGTNLTLSVRTCNNSGCLGETWSDITYSSPQNLSLSNNQYFQYKFEFETDDLSYSPNLQSVNVDYTVLNSAPTILIVEPQNQLYLSNESLALNFIASDSDDNIDSCWYNLNNGTNISLTNCQNTTFNVPTDGDYLLTIYVNDSEGLEADNNVNFNVDSTGVSVSISEPTGTKSSRTTIPITYSTIGNNLTCWYNIKTSIGGEVISNTTLSNCSNSVFDVSIDGNYIFNLYINNTLGSSDFKSSSFSIDTSTTPTSPPASPSGGGGGGGSSSSNVMNLELTPIEVIMYSGEEKSLELVVKNKGVRSVNKCKLKTSEEHRSLISSTDIKNIASGEIVEFAFTLTLADATQPELFLECLEGNESVQLEIILINPSLNMEFSEIRLTESNEIFIKYLIESESDLVSNLIFSVYSNKEKIAEQIQEVKLTRNEKTEEEVLIEFSDIPSGLLKISVINEGEDKPLVESSIVYDSNMISGFATANFEGDDRSYIAIIIGVFAIFVIIIIRKIIKNQRKKK
ncbi:hypothetical protein KAJ38_01260 [Candidatus Pacearchaeota archaeon]|nr:hypothetical protein [Candidatus Pacearchaeota archaeon]